MVFESNETLVARPVEGRQNALECYLARSRMKSGRNVANLDMPEPVSIRLDVPDQVALRALHVVRIEKESYCRTVHLGNSIGEIRRLRDPMQPVPWEVDRIESFEYDSHSDLGGLPRGVS